MKAKALAVGGCAAALLTSALFARPGVSAAAQPQPSSAGAGIRVVSVNGSGCPHGTASIHELPGLVGFTATYKNFLAAVGPGNVVNFRKNCQFGVRMQAPPGYAYTAVSAQYRGYGRLAKGMRGQQETSYYFQGQPQTVSPSHSLPGPLRGYWSRSEHVLLSALGAAGQGSAGQNKTACGQVHILNINAQLIVYPGATTSGPVNYLTLNSASHGYTTYRFTRARCP